MRAAIQPKPTSGPAISAEALAGLIQTLREINQQSEFVPLVSTVLKTACRLFRARAASVLLANKMTGLLEIAAVENVLAAAIQDYQQQPVRSQAVEEAEDVLAEPNRETAALHQLALAGLPQATVLPIHIQEKIIGVLTLAADVPLLQGGEDEFLRDIFLEYIAQALENAYLIFQLRQQNGRLEMMMTKLQTAQNHLERAEKMALAGKIATAVAHEIRNPLTVIGTSLQLVLEKMEPEHPERNLYEIMVQKVRSVDQTLKELLNFSRPIALRPAPVSLAETLQQVVTFIRHKYASRSLELQLEVPPALPRVCLDEEQAQRIFLNLFLNAHAFLPEKGRVHVRAWEETGKPWVCVSFADNGPGIPPEHAQKLFEPFFTTRSDGTGLGLFLVKYLLEAMNGSIEFRSLPGAGTEFLLRLPRADQPAA